MKRLVEAFTRFALRHTLPEQARHDMYVALDEVISNAVKHGKPRGGKMRLELSLADATLEAIFTDDGPAFNPLQAPRPNTDQPLMDRPIGGLGILLMTELMDTVRYTRESESNRLVLRKKLSRPR